MNMIDIQDLKSQITDDNIKDIMDDLNISFVKENAKELIQTTDHLSCTITKSLNHSIVILVALVEI